jgi:hypothetical protein
VNARKVYWGVYKNSLIDKLVVTSLSVLLTLNSERRYLYLLKKRNIERSNFYNRNFPQTESHR